MKQGIYVGTAGWLYEDWFGPVYPSKKSSKFKPLEFLIEYVDLIEINSSFYRAPSSKTVFNWAKIAEGRPDFLFNFKLWEGFTHKIGRASDADVTIFKNGIQPLLERKMLGALLIQFPWSFGYSKKNLDYLLKLSKSFIDFNPSVELRNKNWNNETVLKTLKDNGIGFVNIDQPKSVSSLNKTCIVTSKTGYFRLHGRNSKAWFDKTAGRDEKYNYTYSEDELVELANLVASVSDKAEKTFVVSNNHFEGSAFANSLQLKAKLTGEKVKMPDTILEKFKNLKNIAGKIDRYLTKQASLF